MKKIAVVTTGGTIGSYTENGVIRVSARRHPMVGHALEGMEYELFSPLNLLSENACPQTWNEIIRFLRSLDQSRYGGIILMHGTDTLCYTAAAVAYTMRETLIPIVLVSAAYEPDDPRSNARINLQGAADFIQTGGLIGVFAAYSNGGDCEIHLGSRLEEISDYGAQLRSYGGGCVGTICRRRPNPTESADVLRPFQPIRPSPFSPDFPMREQVALIKAYPGIDYARIDPSGYRAVLHVLYHSGTGRTEGPNSLPDFIRQCAQMGIDSYFTPAHRGNPYSTTLQLTEAGAVPLPAIGMPAAYVKLVYYYNTPGLLPEILSQNLALEELTE